MLLNKGLLCFTVTPENTAALDGLFQFTDSKTGLSTIYYHFCSNPSLFVQLTQRNRYLETGCNGTPSLANMTDFYVNATETFCDGARVCTMVIDERHSTVPSTQLLTSWLLRDDVCVRACAYGCL